MTYQVTFREGEEPAWFVKAYDIAWANKLGSTIPTWANVWDNYYPNTMLSHSVRDITVTFESEQAFTMFLLRWV